MSTLKQWVNLHPKLAAWIVLAIGMVLLVMWSAKDVGLLPGQMLALVVATIGLAGLCVWIIGWESGDEEDEPAAAQAAPGTPSPGPAPGEKK